MDSTYDFIINEFQSSEKELSEDLNRLVKKFSIATKLLGDQPEEIKQRLAPIIAKSAAIIAIELQNEYQEKPDKERFDKRKRLELEAKALELLQNQYKERI
jgi:hypothetical protein